MEKVGVLLINRLQSNKTNYLSRIHFNVSVSGQNVKVVWNPGMIILNSLNSVALL